MPILTRLLINIHNDDEHHKAVVKRQTKMIKEHDTTRNYSILPIGSTVAVQREDSYRWTHGTILGKGDHNHLDCSYII